MSFATDEPKPNGDDTDNTLLYKIAIRLWRLVYAGTESLFSRPSVNTSTSSQTGTSEGTDSAAGVNLTATPGRAQVLDGIAGSYYGAANLPSPVAPGTVTITTYDADNNPNVLFVEMITAPGAWFFPVRRKGTIGKALEVSISAGGTDVSGVVNVCDSWTE